MKVLCVGDAVIDAFLTIKEGTLFKPGEKIPVDSCQFLLGGNACNVSVGLSRLGISTSLCAEIGDDEFSQKIINSLTHEGVDTSNILQTTGAMSSFAVSIQGKNDRTLFVYHVERKHHFDLTKALAEWVYLSSIGRQWKGTYQKVLSLVQNNNIKLAFNPGTPQLSEGYESISDILKNTDILFVNFEEAQGLVKQVTGKTENKDIATLLSKLQDMGPKTVVITNGKYGSYSLDGNLANLETRMASYPATVVQKTGAGDAYTAGFLAAYMEEEDPEEAMRWGSANAASVIGKIGAQRGLLRREEINIKLEGRR